MKRRILALLFLVPLLFVNACSNEMRTASKEPTTILKNREYGYELTFPPGWFLHEHDSRILKDYAAQSDGSYSTEGIYNNKKGWGTEVVVNKKTRFNTFEKIYKNHVEHAYKRFGPLEGKITKTDSYFRGACEYREVIFETWGMGPRAKHQSTFVDRDDYVLIIHSSCVIRSFDTAKKDFDSIADSLRFF